MTPFRRRNHRLSKDEAEAQLRAAYGEYWGHTKSGFQMTVPDDEDPPQRKHSLATWLAFAAFCVAIAALVVVLSGVELMP